MSLKIRARNDKMNTRGLVPVSIQYTNDGKSYLYPTGISANPNLINDSPKDGKTYIKKCDGFNSMNRTIKEKFNELDSILDKLGGKPSIIELRSYINQKKHTTPKVQIKTLIDSFAEYLEHPRLYSKGFERWNPKTYNQYTSIFNTLKELDPKKSILLKDVNQDWVISKLEPALKAKGQKVSTINKGLKNLKAFLKACFDKDFIEKNIAAKIKLITLSDSEKDLIEEPYVINIKQATRLINLPLAKRLDNARNLFLILFWTGQRYGDLEQLLKDRSHLTSFTLKQAKRSSNGKQGIAEIPVTDSLKELWKRDNRHLLSSQKLNKYIKEIVDVYNSTFEDLHINKDKTTCHTARRSLLTMLYDSKTSRNDIMKISGHKKESTLLIYINREATPDISQSVETLNRLQNMTA